MVIALLIASCDTDWLATAIVPSIRTRKCKHGKLPVLLGGFGGAAGVGHGFVDKAVQGSKRRWQTGTKQEGKAKARERERKRRGPRGTAGYKVRETHVLGE